MHRLKRYGGVVDGTVKGVALIGFILMIVVPMLSLMVRYWLGFEVPPMGGN